MKLKLNKYTLTHEFSDGLAHYHFLSEKSFADLQHIVGAWGEQDTQDDEELEKLVKLLNVDGFDPKRDEFLTLSYFEEPTFLDIAGQL